MELIHKIEGNESKRTLTWDLYISPTGEVILTAEYGPNKFYVLSMGKNGKLTRHADISKDFGLELNTDGQILLDSKDYI